MQQLLLLVLSLPVLTGQYKLEACSYDEDCNAARGEVCWRKYSGCLHGQCMCRPGTHRYDTTRNTCVPILRYGDSCNPPTRPCPERMSCVDGRCLCNYGEPTENDGEFCLRTNERRLGQSCTGGSGKDADICYKKAATFGYTTEDVFCYYGHCICGSGMKSYYGQCRKYRLGEKGCLKDHHCERGALCVESQCACPSGFVPDNNRCVKNDALLNLGLGDTCDELGQTSYCASHLICHKCPGDQISKCVQVYSSDSTKSRPHASFLIYILLVIFIQFIS